MKIMQKQNGLSILLLSAALATESVMASDVTGLTSFTAGTPARAADVNGNFNAVKTAVDDSQVQITWLTTVYEDNFAQITALETANATLEARIAALETKLASVTNTTENGQPTVLFRGVNVRIDNGLGSTPTANGTGNLIVGYNEADTSGIGRCTIGTSSGIIGLSSIITDSTSCTNSGGAWVTTGFKTGSHYIVTGTQNNYSSWGGLLAGRLNTSNHHYASAIGGYNNTASGSVSTVTGGHHNWAAGDGASVSGGWANTASGAISSVSGGARNTASGDQSSVSGGGSTTVGQGNIADTALSSILGGNSQNTSTASQTIPALP